MATIAYEHVTKRFGDTAAVTTCRSTSRTGSSSCSSARPAAARRQRCACSPGSRTISEGRILIGDRVVNNVAPGKRDIAMVFQSYALYPHMTVYGNLAFSLKNFRRAEAGDRSPRARGGRDPRAR